MTVTEKVQGLWERWQTPLLKRAPKYALSALFCLLFLYAFTFVAQSFPPVFVACVWIIVSGFFSIGLAYPSIIKKNATRQMFRNSSEAAKRINGRSLRCFVSFVVGAVLAATLMIESQKWTGAEWIVAALSIPIYLIVSTLVTNFPIKREYRPFFQRRASMLWSWVLTSFFLALLMAFVAWKSGVHEYQTIGEALSATQLLFDGSSSALLEEVGVFSYLVDALTSFGLSSLAGYSYGTALIIGVALSVSSSIALAHIMSLCSLGREDLCKVFHPLEGMEGDAASRRSAASGAAKGLIAGALMLVLFFAVAEMEIEESRQGDAYTPMQSIAREQIGLSVYEVNGIRYDADTVDTVFGRVLQENAGGEEKKEALIQAVNAAYDTCRNNVDGYLAWFNPGFFDDFGKFFSNAATDTFNLGNRFDHQEYWNRITEGVDFGSIESCAQALNDEKVTLRTQVEDELRGLQLLGIPDWLTVEMKPFDDYFQEVHFESSLVLDDPQGDYTQSDAYRAAILEAIENGRAEMLAQLQ